MLIALASACLAIPLVLAAVGHAIVASDQVRSDGLQTEIAQALQTQQDFQLQKAELVAPTRILSIAETQLHMVTPASVTYLSPVNPGESVAQAHEPGHAVAISAAGSTPNPRSSRPSEDATASGSTP
jgi:cell division protein FtsL